MQCDRSLDMDGMDVYMPCSVCSVRARVGRPVNSWSPQAVTGDSVIR